jgi:hypothetical protein
VYQEGDFFAATPLLQATHWWRDAGVVVLDEFDPSQLTRTVQLTSADLAAMVRASCCSHAKAVVRWLAQVLASTTERTLTGSLLYQELEAAADAEGLSFAATLRLAVDAGRDAAERIPCANRAPVGQWQQARCQGEQAAAHGHHGITVRIGALEWT